MTEYYWVSIHDDSTVFVPLALSPPAESITMIFVGTDMRDSCLVGSLVRASPDKNGSQARAAVARASARDRRRRRERPPHGQPDRCVAGDVRGTVDQQPLHAQGDQGVARHQHGSAAHSGAVDPCGGFVV